MGRLALVGALLGLGCNAGLGGSGGIGGSELTPSRIFVTDTTQDAALGGIVGADGLCAAQAAAASLQGDFRAWLSTSSSPVGDRFAQSGGPYVLVDGTRIADNWGDLTDGSIQAPINLDANGLTRGGDVWTGTLPDGSTYSGGD
ncbi:MAG: hypothetical protein JSU89_09230, partial [Myxococcales bacterium]